MPAPPCPPPFRPPDRPMAVHPVGAKTSSQHPCWLHCAATPNPVPVLFGQGVGCSGAAPIHHFTVRGRTSQLSSGRLLGSRAMRVLPTAGYAAHHNFNHIPKSTSFIPPLGTQAYPPAFVASCTFGGGGGKDTKGVPENRASTMPPPLCTQRCVHAAVRKGSGTSMRMGTDSDGDGYGDGDVDGSGDGEGDCQKRPRGRTGQDSTGSCPLKKASGGCPLRCMSEKALVGSFHVLRHLATPKLHIGPSGPLPAREVGADRGPPGPTLFLTLQISSFRNNK